MINHVSGFMDDNVKLSFRVESFAEAQKRAIEMLSFHDFDYIKIEVFTDEMKQWQVTRHKSTESIDALILFS